MQNAFIESFNGACRDDCLNQHWFSSLAEARLLIEGLLPPLDDESVTIPAAGAVEAGERWINLFRICPLHEPFKQMDSSGLVAKLR